MESPLISYVVGVRNMQDTIGKTIESILNQDYPNKEIIVINDGSDDNTEDILKKYPIKFINTEKNGISNARNLGYRTSKGEYIAYTDADCELDSLWTKKILEGFDGERVGLIGGVIVLKTDESFSSIYRSIEFSKRFNNVKNQKVVWAGGAGAMFRRKVLDKIGGFNPEWFHGEDAEISFLTVEHGYKVLQQNDAITYHAPENTFISVVRRGFRDAIAYVRVTKSHLKTSLRNKFNIKWYFSYDMLLLPVLYAFIIISGIFLLLLYFLNYYLYLPFLKGRYITLSGYNWSLMWRSWLLIFILIWCFLFIYGLIPSFQVASYSKNKKIKAFLSIILLHHVRGLAWGIGLMIGIKNLITRKY